MVIAKNNRVHHYIGKLLNPNKMKTGYLRVSLHKDGFKTDRKVHQLVAEHFIPNTFNKPYINHLDEDKTNNNVNNLEWCTPLENTRHGTGIKRGAEGKKIRICQFDMNNNYIKTWKSATDASEELGIEYTSIVSCCTNPKKYLSAGNFRWMYEKDYINGERLDLYIVKNSKKPLKVIKIATNEVFIFNSKLEASKFLNYSTGLINKNLKGASKSKLYKFEEV